ncbi:hypothetical protein ACYG9U_26520 [Mesorhizobium sp. W033]
MPDIVQRQHQWQMILQRSCIRVSSGHLSVLGWFVRATIGMFFCGLAGSGFRPRFARLGVWDFAFAGTGRAAFGPTQLVRRGLNCSVAYRCRRIVVAAHHVAEAFVATFGV